MDFQVTSDLWLKWHPIIFIEIIETKTIVIMPKSYAVSPDPEHIVRTVDLNVEKIEQFLILAKSIPIWWVDFKNVKKFGVHHWTWEGSSNQACRSTKSAQNSTVVGSCLADLVDRPDWLLLPSQVQWWSPNYFTFLKSTHQILIGIDFARIRNCSIFPTFKSTVLTMWFHTSLIRKLIS